MKASVQCLTPPGSAAIAVLEVSGPNSWEIVRRLFQPVHKPLPQHPSDLASWFGRIGPGAGDEGLLVCTRVEPIPALEIHCHGGKQVVDLLIGQLIAEGCEPSDVRQNLTEIERLLIEAKTVRTAAILIDQMHGAFERALITIRSSLQQGVVRAAADQLESVKRFESLGRHLLTGWRVVIAGRPNAGKSSLMNTLTGYQRSVVTPIPGTTRDVVAATAALDGWLVEFRDTAGLREGADELEQQGIERALGQIHDAELCLWVVDVQELTVDWQKPALSVPTLVVINKSDLPHDADLAALFGDVAVSAISGNGLENLIAKMVDQLVPVAPGPGDPVPYSEECVNQLRQLEVAINRAGR